MPKRKFAHREKVKPKSIKSKAKLGSKRKLSRFGKKQLKGHAGTVIEYIARTKAIKKLHITLRDFRCVVNGSSPLAQFTGDAITFYICGCCWRRRGSTLSGSYMAPYLLGD